MKEDSFTCCTDIIDEYCSISVYCSLFQFISARKDFCIPHNIKSQPASDTTVEEAYTLHFNVFRNT